MILKMAKGRMDAGEAIQKKCLIHMTIHLHQKHHSSFSSGTYGISIKDNRMIDSRFWMSAEHFFLDVPQVCHTQMFEIKLIPPPPKKVIPSFILHISEHEIFHQFKHTRNFKAILDPPFIALSQEGQASTESRPRMSPDPASCSLFPLWPSDTGNTNPSSRCY